MASGYVTVNDVQAVEARVSFPRVGAWTADAVLVDAVSLGAASIVLAASVSETPVKLKGTIIRGDTIDGVTRVRIVGGAGGLGTLLQAQGYFQISAGVVLKDALRGAGEALSATADPGTLAAVLPAWTRAQGAAGASVQALAELAGVAWRVMQDGTIWIGPETWPVSSPDYQLLGKKPELGVWDVFMDPPALLPGTTFAGAKVAYVEHYLAERQLRTQVTFEDDAQLGQLERGKGWLARFFRQLVGRKLDHLALYPAVAVSQNGDGTLELVMDNARIGQLSRVPIRYGVPGVTAQVAPGARVLLGYAEGNPSKPIATLWEKATVTQLVVPASSLLLGGAGASHPLIFGDDFSTVGGAFDVLVKAIATAVGTIPAGAPAATAINTALGVYQTSILTKLSAITKTS